MATIKKKVNYKKENISKSIHKTMACGIGRYLIGIHSKTKDIHYWAIFPPNTKSFCGINSDSYFNHIGDALSQAFKFATFFFNQNMKLLYELCGEAKLDGIAENFLKEYIIIKNPIIFKGSVKKRTKVTTNIINTFFNSIENKMNH